jgi:hypothetical protein
LFVVVVVFGYPVAYYISSETIEITIKDKERITTGSGKEIESKFLVYAEGEVFENTDSKLYLKFNSADLQNELEVGNSYKAKVAGWRVPIFDWYRNVIKLKE